MGLIPRASADESAPAAATSAPAAAPAPAPAAATSAPAAAPAPAPAAATSAPAAAPAPAPAAAERFTATIVGARQPLSRGGADYRIDVGGLAAVPRAGAGELLKLAPGVLLTNDGSQAHADQVFLRGFDAREGQDIEFSVGGVPINEVGNIHGNGYADTHFIIPELVASLRVIEGPFDPRQGNFAVAGSADYALGLQQRGVTSRFTTGSFGTHRGLLLWGPAGASAGTFAGVELYQTDGFGQNRDGRRATVMAQYEGGGSERRFRIAATAYLASFHSAGVLRQDDLLAGRVGFFDTYDTRQGAATSRYSLSGELESRLGKFTLRNQAYFIARPFLLRENFTGFLLDPQEPPQSPHGQRGDLIELQALEFTLGVHGSAGLSTTLLGQIQRLEVGYYARGDFVSASQQRIEAATGHPYHIETDLESRLGDIGLYADVDLRPLSWLALRGGVRADLFTYDVLDRCAVQSVAHPSRSRPPGDASCLSQQDFGNYREPTQRATTTGSALLPRVTLALGPFGGLSAAVSYGRGARSIDPIYITQDARTPFASAESIDSGLSFVRRLGRLDLSLRSAFFMTRVDRDLIFSETAGRNVLGGATTRIGSASAARLTAPFFDVAANLTYVSARFDDTGLLIPYIPEWVLRFDGSVFGDVPIPRLRLRGRPLRGTLAAGLTYVAPRPLPLGERGNTMFTLDVHGSIGWWLFDLGLACTNLLDARYRLGEYNYASDFRSQRLPTLVPTRHFSAGAPQAVMFTLAMNLGGGR